MVADKARFIAAGNRAQLVNPHDLYARLMAGLGRYAGLRIFRVFDRALGSPVPAVAGGLDYRLLDAREVLAHCDDASLELAHSKVRAAYARGDVCAGAFYGAQLAGYCWFAFSAAPHMDRAWLDFPSHVLYTYKSFVRPALRGRGIAAVLYPAADALAKERGREAAIICVEAHNGSSIAAARRGGFAPVGYAAYAGRGRLKAWCSPAAARYGLRFFVPE
jgi:GNAT superfamily N-acetyltransferase